MTQKPISDTNSLLSEFKNTNNSKIAILIDYDGTLTTSHKNSWDVVGEIDKSYTTLNNELRKKFFNNEINEEEFWDTSLKYLKDNGFAKKISKSNNAHQHELRVGFDDLLAALSKGTKNIIFSAGLGDVIYPHIEEINKGQDENAQFKVVTNMIEGITDIMSSSKNGKTLLKYAKVSGISLDGITHYIVIGDNYLDAEMANGLDYENILKLGIMSPTYRDDNYIKEAKRRFDFVAQSDDSIEEIVTLLERIL